MMREIDDTYKPKEDEQVVIINKTSKASKTFYED